MLYSKEVSAIDLFTATIPSPVSNNAVTQVTVKNKKYLLSFSGITTNKTYQDVHNKTFIYDIEKNAWKQGKSVPISKSVNGLIGRLASTATSLKDIAYVFGGYTVAKDHSEISVPDVYSYNVSNDTFKLLTPMPVPVDDSVALSYNNRYIYLVSGWHNDGNVNLVQIYDSLTNTWQQASPFPGKAVFGHAGAIVDNTMVICDGVRIDVHAKKRRTYASEAACYIGKIKDNTPNIIDWNLLKHPTGIARYRMAAAGIDKKKQIVFIGGSDNPYNYNGIGYNNHASLPSEKIWVYDIKLNRWNITKTKNLTMDHRGLLIFNNTLVTIGGMDKNQQVLNTINHYQYPLN